MVLEQSGRGDWYLPPVTDAELEARAERFGGELPECYIAVARATSGFGAPGALLDAEGIVRAQAQIRARLGAEGEKRYFPVATVEDTLVALDRGHGPRRFGGAPRVVAPPCQLPVVELVGMIPRARAHDFAHWLDDLADEREESMEAASRLPPRLRELLANLGFRFDSPLLGTLATSDVRAMTELLGAERARRTRGEINRLFDATGATVLTINVDDFSMTGRFRTGDVAFEAEDVFRWLRTFRNENFYAESADAPIEDLSRDLREAPPEPPLVVRGARVLDPLPAERYTFHAAAGRSPSDFFVLGRATAADTPSPSLLLHFVDGKLESEVEREEALNGLHIERDGTLWGLTSTHAIRFERNGGTRAIPLARRTPGRTLWHGMGSAVGRVVVWGAGALLELSGNRFVPFSPDAGLDVSETVLSVHAHKLGLSMLVSGAEMGAVAAFDGKRWSDIRQDQVIGVDVSDLDVFRGAAFVLDREGTVWREERAGRPRPVPLEQEHPAFADDRGAPRPTHALRLFEGGMLLASDGGVLSTSGDEPLFYRARGCDEPARLVRLGSDDRESLSGAPETAILALCGPHVWLWTGESFKVLDMTEW